jgi:co-chaperonin GroES (HSP10)
MSDQVPLHIPENVGGKYSLSSFKGVYENRMPLTKDSKPLNDLILLEMVKQSKDRGKVGGLFLPEETMTNRDVVKARVLAVGPNAKDLNLKPGTLVIYDRFSAFGNPPLVPGTLTLTKVENIIGAVSEDF